MAPTSAPTSEIGVGQGSGTLSWGTFIDDKERVPELRWPRSVIEYDRMRNYSQINALYMGTTLPLRRYRYEIDPNGADAGVVDRLSEDVGLPIKGSSVEVDDTASHFNHDDHLRHALLSLIYGHMFGEISGEVVDGWWRLRKIAPRMPLTIASIETENDGGLKGIRQNISKNPRNAAPLIEVERLLAFTWEREGSNWAGRSILRPLYGNWLIAQRLIRVDATKHERTGMGVPIARATVPEVGRAALAKLAQMASRLRGGQNAGGALPYGTDLKLQGVEGNVPDTLASVRYHDEAMARSMLMMFIQLGQTETGSRALGESFIDFFALSLEAIAEWYTKLMTRVLFRRWVVWNVGESSPTPRLTYDPGPRELATTELQAMIDSGAITVDAELEGWVRGRSGLPTKAVQDAPSGRSFSYDLDYGVLTVDERRAQIGLAPLPNGTGDALPVPSASRTEEEPPAEPPVTPTEARRRPVSGAATSPIPLPDRQLRRQPNAHEVAAAVDFATLEEQFVDAVSALVAAWQSVRDGQIQELADIIAQTDATDLEALSAVEVESGESGSVLLEVMEEVASSGAAGAVDEAGAQGIEVELPDLGAVNDLLGNRADAIAALLARSLSEAAARKATNLAGGALSADDIANEVSTYLGGLSDAYLEEQFSGAVTQAQNAGRKSVMAETEDEVAKIVASELLDGNTCGDCKAVDGTEYESLAAAELDYPTGGYKNCQGGPHCRGTLVAIYADEAEPTVE